MVGNVLIQTLTGYLAFFFFTRGGTICERNKRKQKKRIKSHGHVDTRPSVMGTLGNLNFCLFGGGGVWHFGGRVVATSERVGIVTFDVVWRSTFF